MLCHGGPGRHVGLERMAPRVRRVILPEAGHLPWVEDPKGFREAVTAALR